MAGKSNGNGCTGCLVFVVIVLLACAGAMDFASWVFDQVTGLGS